MNGWIEPLGTRIEKSLNRQTCYGRREPSYEPTLVRLGEPSARPAPCFRSSVPGAATQRPSPNSESLMMTPLGVQAAASAQLCSCARYDMMPPRPVKLGVWPFISFDLGSWHHDKHAFSVQGRISPNVPTRRAWLHLTEACSSSSWPLTKNTHATLILIPSPACPLPAPLFSNSECGCSARHICFC